MLTRHYHSRSNRPGAIGYGWCFAFEAQVIRVSDHRWRVYECGSQNELTDFIRVPERKGIWANQTQPDDILIEGISEIIRPRRSQIFYRKSGYLKSFKTLTGKTVTLLYHLEDQLKEMRVSDGSWIRFQYNPQTQKIEKAFNDKNELIHYHYEKQNLISVQLGSANLWRYSYDDFHNVTEVRKGNRRIASLRYDTANDRVVEYKSEHGCQERYSYKEVQAKGEETFIADIERTCRRKEKSKSRFKFLYLELNKFQRSLAQMTIETEEERTIISFDRQTGHTLSIEKAKNLRRL